MSEDDKKDIGFWAYAYREIKEKTSKEGLFRIFAIIAGVYVGWMALLPHIDKHLIAWNKKWLMPLDEGWVITAIYILIVIGISAYLYAHVRKKAHMSLMAWTVWTLIVIIYTYYRWFSNAFWFWGGEYIAWADITYLLYVVLIGCEVSYLLRMWRQEKAQTQSESILLRDDAIEEVTDDKFAYITFANELRNNLQVTDISKRAYSVGIVGEWGIGKSSLLNLFAAQLEEAGQIVVRFAPRNAKKTELIQEDFFAIISDVLRKYSHNASYTFGKYAYALNLSSSTRWVYNIVDWFSHWTVASEKEQINTMIRETGKKIYVIIEDLDRLTGAEILEVLKLIDANGNFCNTIFLSAYDKKYVNGVLQKVIGYGDDTIDFTDKYFQYELTLFKQPNGEINNFLYKHVYLWAINNYPDDMGKNRPEYEWQTISRMVLPYISTLRYAKRFVNQFRIIYLHDQAYSKVNLADFAVVTLIRFLDMNTYYNLYEQMYTTYSGDIFTDKKSLVLTKEYKELAEKSKIPHLERLLEFLFDGGNGYRQLESQYHRIARTESFSNYFYSNIQRKLYYGDLNIVMNAATLSESIELLNQYMAEKQNADGSISEFLCSRDAQWVGTSARLERFVCLLAYANTRISSLDLDHGLIRMWHKDVARDYADKIFNGQMEPYVECLMRSFIIMLDYIPYYIGVFMHRRLDARHSDESAMNEIAVDRAQQDSEILVAAQEKYDFAIDGERWSAKESMQLAMSVEGEMQRHIKARRAHARTMLTAHPNEYAEGLLTVIREYPDSKFWSVGIAHYKEIWQTLSGGKRAFLPWTKLIKDVKLRQIYEMLHKYAVTHDGNAKISVEADMLEPTDYSTIVKIMKKQKM